MAYSLWGCTESYMTKQLTHTHFFKDVISKYIHNSEILGVGRTSTY